MAPFAGLGQMASRAAVIGTEILGRPLIDEEKRRFGALLREHEYPGARLVSLRFAYKVARSRAGAPPPEHDRPQANSTAGTKIAESGCLRSAQVLLVE